MTGSETDSPHSAPLSGTTPTLASAFASAPSFPCQFCGERLQRTFVDLGLSPLCESVRRPEDMDKPELFYPLHTFVCEKCWLVQLQEFVTPGDIFTEYAYFSSMSDSWVAHARRYVDMVVERFSLTSSHQIVEIASNDGYLLQNFVRLGIPALGVEPAANVAKVAESRGVKSMVRFFGCDTARQILQQGTQADLLLGNNVLAHVPDIKDFVGGMKILLAPSGVVTMEFPHLLELMNNNQFDTIYHEHFTYLSLLSVERIFGQQGLRVFDVEHLPTHGGSLRIFVCHDESASHPTSENVRKLRSREHDAGLSQASTYDQFRSQVAATKLDILEFFLQAKREGKRVAGYGAPGKGVTLLNYCGIRADFMDYTVDRNAYKQGTFMPGTGIPVHEPNYLLEDQPDYVFILPWNLKDEIISQMSAVRAWGGKFVVPIPRIEIL